MRVHAIAAPAAPGDAPVLDQLAHAAAVHRAVDEIHAREPVDAVVAPLWGCEGIVCLLDGRFPTVVSCMTSATTIEALRGRARADPETKRLIALERATMRRARYVHGLTRGALDRTLSDHGARPAEAAVVGRGLADRGGAAGPAASDPPAIVFLGRLERRKGVATLLEAARRLVAAGLRFTLILAGPDSGDTETGEPYRAAFEREAGQDLAARVRFAGAVPDAERDELLRTAAIVCVPSRYESHGVVLVEAMMFGRPIVACAAGGVAEVVEDGGNALLAEPDDPASLADALARLIADADLRARLGARSRALYQERFEVGRVAEAMEAFLRRVAGAHSAADLALSEVGEGMASVIREVVPEAGDGLAAELLEPPASAWSESVLAAERERVAWQARAAEAEHQVGEWRARALEAERQRAAADASLRAVAHSRWWRLTAPLRRATAALRRRG